MSSFVFVTCPESIKLHKHLSAEHWIHKQNISQCRGCSKRSKCGEYQSKQTRGENTNEE